MGTRWLVSGRVCGRGLVLEKTRENYYVALTGKDFTGAQIAMTKETRDEYFAMTFRGLGHQMHLVQDAAVPEHTRNNAHPFKRNQFGGWSFETRAAKNPTTINTFAANPLFPAVLYNISHNGLDRSLI